MKKQFLLIIVTLISNIGIAQNWEDTRVSKDAISDSFMLKYRKKFRNDSIMFTNLIKEQMKYMCIDSLHRDSIRPTEQMIKDMFLCECIYAGFENDSLYFSDNSRGTYSNLLEEKAILAKLSVIYQLARNIAKSIPVVEEDNLGRRPVIYYCLQLYISQTLDNIVKAYISSLNNDANDFDFSD